MYEQTGYPTEAGYLTYLGYPTSMYTVCEALSQRIPVI